MDAKELHNLAVVRTLTKLLVNMREVADEGKFSFYHYDSLEQPVIAALEKRGFTVKAGFSGGHHIQWITL